MQDDMGSDPRVATVLATLEAYARSDLQAMQQHMSFEVRLQALGNNPLAGTYDGLGGVLAFIAKSTATFEPGSVIIEEVQPTDDDVRVIVKGEMQLLDDTTQTVRILQRYWFDDESKISRITAEAAADPEGFDNLLRERARSI